MTTAAPAALAAAAAAAAAEWLAAVVDVGRMHATRECSVTTTRCLSCMPVGADQLQHARVICSRDARYAVNTDASSAVTAASASRRLYVQPGYQRTRADGWSDRSKALRYRAVWRGKLNRSRYTCTQSASMRAP